MTNRREFLTSVLGSSAVLSFNGFAPDILCRAAMADDAAMNDERVLVVVQMSGGNDGLNTVVPFSHDVYKKNRTKLRIAKDDAISIDREYGFHPAMTGFAKLHEAGELGIVPSVGYDQPNRSHFESMDIWHTCRRKTDRNSHGWLGQFLETTSVSRELPGIHIGRDKQPLALAADNLRIPSIESVEEFRLKSGNNKHLTSILNNALAPKNTSDDGLLGFLQSSTKTAVAANERIEQVRNSGKATSDYPDTTLGRKLGTIARLIKAELPTRVFYVTHDGFDTHARQGGAHESLLRQLSDAVTSLTDDMRKSGNGKRVMVMAFSEFGRRVAENASEGTDHGTAGPLFVAGGSAKSGFIGPHSNLNDLQDGDLTFKTDFRSVYAGILQQWFGVKDSSQLLGGDYKPVSLVKA